MAINLDNVLDPHARAMLVHNRRAGLLAANLANADTPGFKARDIDFRAVLGAVERGSTLRATRAEHFTAGVAGDKEIQYRVPRQPSLDGNTVETQSEQVAFTENAIRYQTSLRFMDGAVKSILLALRGE